MARLSSAEAAARLGVKKETLYAYVSRGLIHPIRDEGSRLSYYTEGDVEALRSRRRRVREGELDTVVATGLTLVEDGNLRVRGVDLVAFVERGAGFEAVVELLWGSERPSAPAPLHWDLPSDALQAAVLRAVQALPERTPFVDRLRVAVAVASALDPMRTDTSETGGVRAGRALLAVLPTAIDGAPATGPDGSSVASRLWPRLGAGPHSEGGIRALDAALALLADHGLASSTLAARIAASVRADLYSIVITGMGVVGGSLHGAASGRVHRLLEAAHESGDVATAIDQTDSAGRELAGLGHSVYRRGDPRHHSLMAFIQAAWPVDPRLETALRILDLVETRTGRRANVDFALGLLTWLARMPAGGGEAIFAVARSAGWIAHGLEEWRERPLRFRPRARYVGLRREKPAPGDLP